MKLAITGSHGLINDKDTKTKCRLYWCLKKFIDWRQAAMLEISTQLCELLPLQPSLWFTSPPPLPPFPKSKYSLYRQREAGRGRGGVLSCVGDLILQEFDTLFLTRFRTYKIALPLLNKSLGGEGVPDR